MANRFPSAGLIESLRSRWPVGSRVELVSLSDPYPGKLVPGSLGSVSFVDDAGTVHVAWDCGSGLGLVYGEDHFRAAPAAAPVPVPAPAAKPAPLSPVAPGLSPDTVAAALSVRESVLSSVAEVVCALNGRLFMPAAGEMLGLFAAADQVGVVSCFEEAFSQVGLAFAAVARLVPAGAATPALLDLVDAFSAVAAAVSEGVYTLCQPGADAEQCPVCGGSV